MKSSPIYTEQELIVLLKQRGEAAFSYLYDNYSAALNGVIINILQDEAIALDVLQEVFVKIWRQIEQYDPSKGKLFTWMFAIARSTAIDTIRSKGWQNSKRNYSLTEDYTLLPDSNNTTDKLELRKAVQALKDEHKSLIELSYFQGYTQEEIAKMTNIPLGTVKTRLRAAIVQLKKQVKI
ncbi:MAG: sigma-70 family RNA polymerase sigma factor [Chitinophagaceae bacterium]